MVPPQESPISQARSWVTPQPTTRVVPLEIAALISSAAAPSTHPPDTDPAISPPAVARSEAPSGRAAEPHPRVTTARPTGPVAASRSKSFSRSRISVHPLRASQPGREVEQRPDARARQQPVHVRQRGPEPGRLRREPRPLGQGIEPEKTIAGAAERSHLPGEEGGVAALPAVGGEQHHGAAPH